MIIKLPYPNKALWPNGRSHWAVKASHVKKHKNDAYGAALEVLPTCFKHNGNRISIKLIVSAKSKGPYPDKDNSLAAAKSYFDGIALAMGVDDKLFDPQPVEFAGRNSQFIIEVTT